MSNFPEPYTHIKNKIKVGLNLFNYATKSDLKSATGVADINKLDIGNLKATFIDFSKLSNVVKNDVFKKTVRDELVEGKVSAIQTIDTSY